MIKDRCPSCGSPYLGEACRYCKGKSSVPLICNCGGKAVDVYMDEQGEWLLCEECIGRIGDEFAPLPLPDFTSEEHRDLPRDTSETVSLRPDPHHPELKFPFPFGLSRREYQVVCMYDKTNQEIAEKLYISESTVAGHWRSAMDKMEIKSRREVPYVLNLVSHDAVPPAEDHPQKDRLSDIDLPMTFSVTITGSLEEMQNLLKNMWRSLKRRR